MLVIFLGLLDLLVAINIIGLHFGYLQSLAVFSIIYLVVKGLIFIDDPFSIMDILVAIYIVVLLFGIKIFLTWLFVAYLMYKFIFSLTTL